MNESNYEFILIHCYGFAMFGLGMAYAWSNDDLLWRIVSFIAAFLCGYLVAELHNRKEAAR
jgi:hypothetical protein